MAADHEEVGPGAGRGRHVVGVDWQLTFGRSYSQDATALRVAAFGALVIMTAGLGLSSRRGAHLAVAFASMLWAFAVMVAPAYGYLPFLTNHRSLLYMYVPILAAVSCTIAAAITHRRRALPNQRPDTNVVA
jgi:hypothetical protein